MELIAYEMQYKNKNIMEAEPEKNLIKCIPFDKKYFDQYMDIYNKCFYEMRKALDIEPYNFLSDYFQIQDKIKDIYLLIIENDIIGSVACYGNEIDDLIVNVDYQGNGYGRKLLIWAMSKIRENNDLPISLHVAKWNDKAVSLYESVGFEVTRMEKIR